MVPVTEEKIMVLGVGNVLLTDEGAGVWALRRLEAAYDFPSNVKLVDGGVLGLSLTGMMMDADRVVIIDAVRGGDEPGTLYRFEWESKPAHIKYKDSLHQIDMQETMGTLALLNQAPAVVVLGVEYQDISNWGMNLTPTVAKALPALVELVVSELRDLGLDVRERECPLEVVDVLGSACQDSRTER
jgi:hydrogenase maturation protease